MLEIKLLDLRKISNSFSSYIFIWIDQSLWEHKQILGLINNILFTGDSLFSTFFSYAL